jgi:D-alanine-D-alanine ligase
MATRTTVTILYNEPYPHDEVEQIDENALGFEPYFDTKVPTTDEDVETMRSAICEQGYNTVAVDLKDKFTTLHRILTRERPDVIFNLVEVFNDSPWDEFKVAGLYELLKVPFTGAPALTLGICQRKLLTKQILLANGIPTPRFRKFSKNSIPKRHGLRYPLIVKPAREDASTGIENESVVTNREDLLKRVEHIIEDYEQSALVEEYIDGRELNVSILGDADPIALPISEIDFSELPGHLHKIVSYQSKWDPSHEAYHTAFPVCPADLPKSTTRRAHLIAIEAFRIMGCRDYARIDIRLSKDRKLYVLEVNPNPDLAPEVGFMRSAEEYGLSYGEALAKIVGFALARNGSSDSH